VTNLREQVETQTPRLRGQQQEGGHKMDGSPTTVERNETNETNELLKALQEDLASRHEAAMKAIESRGWGGYMVKVVLPIVLTTGLGLMVWYFQNQIQRKVDENNRAIQSKVDENNRLLSTRQALTEEFYKQKLDEYKKIGKVIAKLREALDRYDELEVYPELGAQASDNTGVVRDLKESDFLFFSPVFRTQLDELWDIGIRVIGKREEDSDEKKNLADLIKNLRDEMNHDLHTSDLTWPQSGK